MDADMQLSGAGDELPRGGTRMLTVEIHDVSPATWAEVDLIKFSLAEIGVHQPSLLVVPRLHAPDGSYHDLRDHPEMVDRLRDEADAGSEIIQHGLTHRAPGPPPPGLRNALMYHYFSRGCAEFAHLSEPEAVWRLRKGRSILQQCGLEAAGFIAPAWQQSRGSMSAVAALGFRFTAFLNHVLPLQGVHQAVRTLALTFDAPNPLVDRGKRMVMRCFEGLARRAPLLRVALHPADVHGGRPLKHILGRVRKLMRRRRLVSYDQWLRADAQRLRRAA